MEAVYKKLLNQSWISSGKCTNCDFKIIEQEYSVTLPKEYRQIISLSNGGERQFEKTYFQLWTIEEILKRNQSYQIQKYLSKKVICFANDGDLAWVFDYRKSEFNPTVSIVPLGDLDFKSMKTIAKSFIDFVSKLINEEIDTTS